MFQPLALFALIAAAYTAVAAQTLRPYHPRTLRPIAWPADAAGPADRSTDYTRAPLQLGATRLTVVRGDAGHGTCLMTESFVVHDADPDSVRLANARTRADSTAAWHRLWEQPSYAEECTDAYA